MRILGVDPSLANLGWGLIFTADGEHACAYGSVQTRPGASDERRLGIIHYEITDVIGLYEPDIIVMKNVSGRDGEVRGVVKQIADHCGVPVVEIDESIINLILTEKDAPSNDDIRKYVMYHLEIDDTPRPYPACEALAIAMAAVLTGATGI